jgi:repressor LexA
MDKYLTPKQKKVLDYILQYTEAKGYAPSQQEIAGHFGFKSLGTIQHYLKHLGELGFLQKTWNARRGMKVRSTSTSFELPLAGKVAAGRPIEAIERTETLEVPSFMLREGGDHFVLQVQGDSMIDQGILDGDFVVIKKQDAAHNGQTVVALINNEATIKTFYRRKGTIELHAANPNYKPIIVTPRDEFRVEGALAGVIRKIS